jgi:septum formation protein
MLEHLKNKRIILASKSPRRRQLLEGLGIAFEVITHEVDESFPAHLRGEEIALYLAKIKSEAFKQELKDNEIVITADTIVWINNHVLNKPESHSDAVRMLNLLSGNTHQVFTGVCIQSKHHQEVFADSTEVTFRSLTAAEIEFYIAHYSPYDKAGSYGAQDWIGLSAIERLKGSYFNVMGLPTHLVYQMLQKF